MLDGENITEVEDRDEKRQELAQRNQQCYTQRVHFRVRHVDELDANPSEKAMHLRN